jgi:hypothetical protein
MPPCVSISGDDRVVHRRLRIGGEASLDDRIVRMCAIRALPLRRCQHRRGEWKNQLDSERLRDQWALDGDSPAGAVRTMSRVT